MLKRVRYSLLLADYLLGQAVHFVRREPHIYGSLCSWAWHNSREAKLPVCQIEDLVPGISDSPIEIFGMLVEPDGNIWQNDLSVIAATARYAKPEKAFEFGTSDGRTSATVAANIPASALVYTLDIPHDHPKFALVPGEDKLMLRERAGEFHRRSAYRDKVCQLWADSAEFDDSPFAGQMGWILIDGSHSYDYVRNDTEKSLRMLKKGGVILWHDYTYSWPEVVRYLHEQRDQLGIKRIEGTHLAIAFP